MRAVTALLASFFIVDKFLNIKLPNYVQCLLEFLYQRKLRNKKKLDKNRRVSDNYIKN